MDKVNSPVGGGFVQSRGFQNDGAVVQPSQNAVEPVERGLHGRVDCSRWNELLVGYARVSKEQQDLTSQRNGLHAGVGDNRIYYVDHGLTGTNRDRPRLRLALAAAGLGTP
jgi:Resolvase, N terminal domain